MILSGHLKNSRVRAILICVSCLFIYSCENAMQKSQIPADFVVMLGEGGGFTGQWQGVTIGNHGEISRWQGATPGENAKPFARMAAADVEKIWQAIKAGNLMNLELVASGNLTRFVQITAGNKNHPISWAVVSRSTGNTAIAEKFYNDCLIILNKYPLK